LENWVGNPYREVKGSFIDHDKLATTSITYYTHTQAVSGRKRKSNITLEEDRDIVKRTSCLLGKTGRKQAASMR
jgi:hypothetical protein